MKMTNPEIKNCGKESCGCAAAEKPQDQKKQQVEEKTIEEKLDPTHFGDWQVNCRTIDF